MMNHLMIKMAQRASQDKTLFAALIEASVNITIKHGSKLPRS